MKSKKLLSVVGILIVIAVVVALLTRESRSTGYIMDRSKGISIKDVTDSLTSTNFDEVNPGDVFAKDVVNPYTLKFFKFLQKKFAEIETVEGHLEAVHKYLISVMPPEEAEKLFAIYKKFVDYEFKMSEKLKEWGNPDSAENALAILKRIQEYRREVFGKEVADELFGAELKSKEYPIRRSAIINDNSLYAKDKEAKIKQLNKDMWGNEADEIEDVPKPYTKYQERLEIYSKDFSEMSAEQKTEKIRDIRKELFPPDVVERLEGVDAQLEKEKLTEEQYRDRETKLMNNPNLDKSEKAAQLKELQDQMFGEDAEAFRRRENIRLGIESPNAETE